MQGLVSWFKSRVGLQHLPQVSGLGLRLAVRFKFDSALGAADADDEATEHVDQANHREQEERRRPGLRHQQKFHQHGDEYRIASMWSTIDRMPIRVDFKISKTMSRIVKASNRSSQVSTQS